MKTYKVVVLNIAKVDVKEAHKWYDTQLKGLGKRFKNEVKRQIALIKINPQTRSVRYDDVRLAVIEKFPYSIHYNGILQNIG